VNVSVVWIGARFGHEIQNLPSEREVDDNATDGEKRKLPLDSVLSETVLIIGHKSMDRSHLSRAQ
jgi:hypothetical protein